MISSCLADLSQIEHFINLKIRVELREAEFGRSCLYIQKLGNLKSGPSPGPVTFDTECEPVYLKRINNMVKIMHSVTNNGAQELKYIGM